MGSRHFLQKILPERGAFLRRFSFGGTVTQSNALCRQIFKELDQMKYFKQMFIAVSVCTLSVFTTLHALAADDVVTPSELKGGKVISIDEAKQLLDSKSATFVDTRSVVNFGKGHVPGAVTAAYKEKSEKVASFDGKLDSFELDKLPKNKAAGVVFYSDGPTGWKSYKAAVLAIGAGHTNVRYMRGGFADWSSKGLPVER
jgi:rhodanese-related sulfurtransferase